MTGMPVFCGESPHRRSYRRIRKRSALSVDI